jgi:hypothetical protein
VTHAVLADNTLYRGGGAAAAAAECKQRIRLFTSKNPVQPINNTVTCAKSGCTDRHMDCAPDSSGSGPGIRQPQDSHKTVTGHRTATLILSYRGVAFLPLGRSGRMRQGPFAKAACPLPGGVSMCVVCCVVLKEEEVQ